MEMKKVWLKIIVVIRLKQENKLCTFSVIILTHFCGDTTFLNSGA
jgi:hypothetical protein